MRHNVIFIIAVLLSWAGLLRAADDGRTDCVTALPVQMVPGGQAVLQLWLQGDDGYEADGRTYRSLQFDLVLPKGITLIENEASGEYQYSQGDLFSTGTNVSIALKEGDADANRYRLIIYNVLNTRFTAPSGALLSLWLQADADVPTASQLTATIEGQILGQTGDANVHAANQPITLTTAGYVKGERGRGVYNFDFHTDPTLISKHGDASQFVLYLDETEALQKDGHPYRSAQFDLHLPKGMALKANADGEYVKSTTYTKITSQTGNHEVSITKHDDEEDPFYRVLLYSLTEKNFGKTKVEETDATPLFMLYYDMDATFKTGDYAIRIDNQVLGVDANKSVTADPYEFTMHHDVTRYFHEDSVTSAAGTAYPVNVDFKASMKANEWRTFSLPFSLTEQQVKELFGDDVQLAVPQTKTVVAATPEQLAFHFNSCDVSAGIEAQKPYLIRPSKDVDEALIRDVIVKVGKIGTKEEMFVIDPTGTGVQLMVAGVMVGSYIPIDGEERTYASQVGTTSYPNMLVIDGQEFYSSVSKPTLPAFNCIFYHRAINNLLKNLTDVAYVEPQTEINMTFEDGQTKTVSGQVVTEGDKQYVAVGKTRYEVLETLGTPVGDVNGDKTVTIADVTALVNIILGKTESPGDVADVNGDHSVTIADVTALVNIILGKTEGGIIGTGYKVRNVSPVVGYVDGEEVITWGGSADGQQE